MKVCEAMKPGARLAVKDTLNNEGENTVYFYNMCSEYAAVYRSVESYFEVFERAGLELEKSVVLDSNKAAAFQSYSLGAVWIKRGGRQHEVDGTLR